MTMKVNGAKLIEHTTKEAATMGNAEAVKRYHQILDEFKIRPYADEGQAIRAYAAAHGISVQALFLEAVREYIANHQVEDNE